MDLYYYQVEVTMKTVDLFAGCGGMSLGFENAGFNLVAAFEFWPIAAECYSKNFSHPVFRTDLSDTETAINQIKDFSPELIIGGPPCQDFSHAGKRIEAERASLTESFAQIIASIKPKYFVMENVDRAVKSKAFSRAENIFKEANYGLTKIILDASKCGVPQKRKRFFCIGALNKEDNFMLDIIEKGISEHETTLRDYFGDTLDFEYYYRHPRNYNRRAVFSIDEPAPTMRGMNRPVPKGYPGHPNDACPINENIRALTTLERSLIQTCPATYKWCGNKTDMEQMIGNAVPVKLAEYVANCLKQYIDSEISICNNCEMFVDWLVTFRNLTQRTASDTLSRVRRADRLYPINSVPDGLYFLSLSETYDFSQLSPSVKSQIKRSLMLYREFIQQISSTTV